MKIWMLKMSFGPDWPRPAHTRIMGFYRTVARAEEKAQELVKAFSGGPGEATEYSIDEYELED